MKIIYEENVINNFISLLKEGKLVLFYSLESEEIIDEIEIKLKNNNISYKLKSEMCNIEELDGVTNVIAIGDCKLYELLCKNKICFDFIPTSLKLGAILNMFLNEQVIYLDKKLVLELPSNEYASMLGQIAYSIVLNFDLNSINLLKSYELESREDIIDLYIKFVLTKNDVDIYNLAQTYNRNSELQIEFDMFFIAIITYRMYGIALNCNEDLLPPIDFDKKLKDLTKILKQSSVDILQNLSKLKDLEILAYMYKDNQIEYLEMYNKYSSFQEKAIKYFKKCFVDHAYNMKIDVQKILKFISDYSLMLPTNLLLFKLSILGLV